MIYLTGDTHGSSDIHKLNSKNFPKGNTLTKNDYVIILGDFGLIWNNDFETDEEKYWLNWLNTRNWTTIIILGNHDNWQQVRKYEQVRYNGAKAYKIRDSIYVIERGEILTLEDKTFFCFGGGFSIDAFMRTEGISWWKEELPTIEECHYAFDKLDDCDWEVDYVLTHDLPEDMLEYFMFSSKRNNMSLYNGDQVDIEKFLKLIKSELSFKKWYCGHFHIDDYIFKYNILYNNVVELDSNND